MRLYVIVDPINHIFQIRPISHFGLMPLYEFPVSDFEEFHKKVNAAWDLYQRSVLQPTIIQDIENIAAIDKI